MIMMQCWMDGDKLYRAEPEPDADAMLLDIAQKLQARIKDVRQASGSQAQQLAAIHTALVCAVYTCPSGKLVQL